MKNEEVTFSVDRKLTKKDWDESAKLAQNFFHTENKLDEIQISEENKRFLQKYIPDCHNIIRAGRKVIGSTFIIPCNKELMKKFLTKKISEKDLFEEVKKKITYKNFDTIYLCSSFLKEEYRGRGLAIEGRIKSIKKILQGRRIKPILFSWAQTKEGKKSVKRTASLLRYELKLRV